MKLTVEAKSGIFGIPKTDVADLFPNANLSYLGVTVSLKF